MKYMKYATWLSGFFLLTISLASAAAPTIAHPFYGELGLGFAQSFSGGKSNQQTIYQGPGTTGPLNLISKNKTPRSELGLSLGGGYEFPLEGPLSWSIGGRLSMMTVKTKGNGVLAGNPNVYQYHYKTDVLDLSTVGRLYYKIKEWDYYVGASLGLAQLSSGYYSSNYAGTDTNGKRNKQIISYGIQGGAFYTLPDNFSLGSQLSYQDEGVAELGAKGVAANGRNPAAPQGRLKQALSFMQLSVQLRYHF